MRTNDSASDHVMHPDRAAQHQLWTPAGLDEASVGSALASLMVKGVDHADVYSQATNDVVWTLEDGLVKSRHAGHDCGMGVRAVRGEQTGFAYSDGLSPEALAHCVQAAGVFGKVTQVSAHAASAQQFPPLLGAPQAAMSTLYTPQNPLESLSQSAQVTLLQELDQFTRALDSRIERVHLKLSMQHEVMLLARHDGLLVADWRPLVRLDVQVVAHENGRRETGFAGGGGRCGLALFTADDGLVQSYAKEAVRLACLNLEAQDAPAGEMPVVLGAGWPGVLFHEAVGHGLEADFNRKGSSCFSDALGQQVAAPCCTIVDNGQMAQRRGSLHVDDEGTPTQCNVLVEKGVLKQYMQDLQSARLMGMAPTGNGRRESYAHLPMPRMTNTYLMPGTDHLDDMLASVDRGIYAVNFSGGQVDITSGQFVFSTSEAYLIEHGKVTAPVRNVTLIGSGKEVLQRISMVGSDLVLDPGVGVCGKAGQSVPVGVGQPTLKIDAMTVGGSRC